MRMSLFAVALVLSVASTADSNPPPPATPTTTTEATPALPPTTTTTPPSKPSAPSAASKWKLLVLDATAPDIEKSQAETITSYIASRAARFSTLQVLTASDLRDLVKLESDKQAAGCDEENKS